MPHKHMLFSGHEFGDSNDPFTLACKELPNKRLIDKYVPWDLWINGDPAFLDVLNQLAKELQTIVTALFEHTEELWGILPETREEDKMRGQLESYHIALKDKAYDLLAACEFTAKTYANDPAVLYQVRQSKKQKPAPKNPEPPLQLVQ